MNAKTYPDGRMSVDMIAGRIASEQTSNNEQKIMTGNIGTGSTEYDSNDTETTLRNIAQRIEASEKDETELSEEEREMLGLKSGRVDNGRCHDQENPPRAYGELDTLPIMYSLHRVDGEWLAVERHSNQAGWKPVRHYVTGVGRMDVTGAGLDRDMLEEQLPEVSGEEIADVVEMYLCWEEDAARMLLDDYLGMLMGGHTVYGSVGDSVLINHSVDEMGIEDEELRYEASYAVRDARRCSEPRDMSCGVVDVQASVVFDHGHLLG